MTRAADAAFLFAILAEVSAAAGDIALREWHALLVPAFVLFVTVAARQVLGLFARLMDAHIGKAEAERAIADLAWKEIAAASASGRVEVRH